MSHTKDNNRKPSVADESAIEAIVQQVLSATGRIVPRTEEEVANAETQINEETIRLPNGLTKPPAGPPPKDDAEVDPLRERPRTAASENLARAARCGNEIPTEVLRRMDEDRLNAERKANGNG